MQRRALVHQGITRDVIGGFYETYNDLGYGFLESVYRRGLSNELRRRGLHGRNEVVTEVWCKGERVGFFRIDILVENCVIVEVKAASRLAPENMRQLLNY